MAAEDTRDRRVRRTEAALSDALMELIATKGYDRVTVQDLIDKANVGRSTFYAHYDTKDDLLLAQMNHLTRDLDAHIEAETTTDGPVLPAKGLFLHVAEHQQMFRSLFGSRGIDLVEREARQMLRNRALATIRDREAAGVRHPAPAEARAAFIAGALLAFVQWLLDERLPYSADEANAMYETFVASA